MRNKTVLQVYKRETHQITAPALIAKGKHPRYAKAVTYNYCLTLKHKTMKKYVVLKNYNGSNLLPDVVGQFNDCDDAKAFAFLNHMTDRDHNYTVATVLDGTK